MIYLAATSRSHGDSFVVSKPSEWRKEQRPLDYPLAAIRRAAVPLCVVPTPIRRRYKGPKSARHGRTMS
jgi:hypothetical protein